MKKDMKKATEAKKPILVFSGHHYKIETIPLNYRMTIKSSLEHKIPNYAIGREVYSDLKKGIEFAHQEVKEHIQDHFQPLSRSSRMVPGRKIIH